MLVLPSDANTTQYLAKRRQLSRKSLVYGIVEPVSPNIDIFSSIPL